MHNKYSRFPQTTGMSVNVIALEAHLPSGLLIVHTLSILHQTTFWASLFICYECDCHAHDHMQHSGSITKASSQTTSYKVDKQASRLYGMLRLV